MHEVPLMVLLGGTMGLARSALTVALAFYTPPLQLQRHAEPGLQLGPKHAPGDIAGHVYGQPDARAAALRG